MTSYGTTLFDHNGYGSIVSLNHCNCLKYIFSLRIHDKNAEINLNIFVKTVEGLRMTSCGTIMFDYIGDGSIVSGNNHYNCH